jgi:spore germination protein YaaH
VRELSVECQKKGIILSMDNYKAESYNAHYDLAEQAAYADYVVLMGYDEHYAGSSSGSVASIGFVEDGIQKSLNYVPKQQLINAMPFYTRIWTESDGKTTSTAVGMQSAINNLSSNGAVAVWDETLGQYFGSYEKDGAVVKVWVEEDRSIEEKLKLYQKYDLAGVAAWKLGLERSSVWSVIAQYVK